MPCFLAAMLGRMILRRPCPGADSWRRGRFCPCSPLQLARTPLAALMLILANNPPPHAEAASEAARKRSGLQGHEVDDRQPSHRLLQHRRPGGAGPRPRRHPRCLPSRPLLFCAVLHPVESQEPRTGPKNAADGLGAHPGQQPPPPAKAARRDARKPGGVPGLVGRLSAVADGLPSSKNYVAGRPEHPLFPRVGNW